LVLNENAVDCDAHSPQAPRRAEKKRTRAELTQARARSPPASALVWLKRLAIGRIAERESQTTAIIRCGRPGGTTSRRRIPVSTPALRAPTGSSDGWSRAEFRTR